MSSLTVALVAMGLLTRPLSTNFVFSAQRFGQNYEKVYALGPAHLYSMRTDGSGLKQITTGQGFDVEPRLAKDGKHILFWRGRRPVYYWDDQARLELYSVGLSGGDLRRLNEQTTGYPVGGFGIGQISRRVVRVNPKSGDISVLDGRGRVVMVADRFHANPSGTRFLAGVGEPSGNTAEWKWIAVDIASHRITRLDPKFRVPVWVDDDTIFANVGKTLDEVLLDSRGREILRKRFKAPGKDSDEESPFGDAEWNGGRTRRAFRLGSNKGFLLQDHHSMSDGGYDFWYRVDMNRGIAKAGSDGSIQAVAPDGHTFVDTEYAWVGGYKGPGAEKLGKMYLWDSKTLTNNPVGFRLMITFGGCFAQAP